MFDVITASGMTDPSIITQLIGSLGFPIAACIALFYSMNKQDEKHKEEIDKLSEALNNNTLIITKLYEKLGGGTDVIK